MTSRQIKLSRLERKVSILLKHLNLDYSFADRMETYVHEQKRYGRLCKRYKDLEGGKERYERI